MSDSDNYKTPEWILDMFPDYFDPCPFNPTPEVDGLIIDWKEKNYVNPPYSNPLPWVLKGIQENKSGKIVVFLLKMDNSTKWYKELVNAGAHFMFPNERIKFNGQAPPWPCVLAILSK